MEQRNHRSRIGIDARQIGSFVPIASITGERQTGRIVGAAVLFRHDVFHVECDERRCQLGKAAIFALVARPGANEAAGLPVQLRSQTREDAAGLGLHNGNDVDGLDNFFVLGVLGGRERSVIRLAA